jgi:hypothetical protein
VTRKRIQETDRFTVQTPTGQRFTLIEYTEFLDAGRGGWIEGLTMLGLPDGQPVNYEGPGQYALLNGTRLTRV